ncbi:hypothetical protein EMA8858_04145 [Emticicia aquatica]|uniref:Uncharacterized protein n=1 Tax=Emticicia aquatica TaxID=1681835 RepID=A0ABN8EY21_9BACT|nr:hypothetical protein EMA8858_04145 [Emticicia aquatica]
MENDIENFNNAEYWRLKYFQTKGNYGSIIIVLSLALLSLLIRLYVQ